MRADGAHMLAYGDQLRAMRAPTGRVAVSPLVPTADTESVIADKIAAMAFRSYTKEPDYFELWWLTAQQGYKRPMDDPQGFCRQLDTTLAIYGDDRADFAAAVDRIGASRDFNVTAVAIERNVPEWLPESVTRQLGQRGMYYAMAAVANEVVDEARDACVAAGADDREGPRP